MSFLKVAVMVAVLFWVAPIGEAAASPAHVRHFVAFRFKPGVTEEQRQEVKRRFLALKKTCLNAKGKAYILDIEMGSADSPEKADQGFQQGYLVTFASTADRDYYVGKPFFTTFDPAHDAFKQFVGPLLDVDQNGKTNGAFVFDFRVEGHT